MTFISPTVYRRKNDLANETTCTLCGAALTTFKYRAMPQWKIAGLICGNCYDRMLLEHYIQPDRRSITKK